MYLWMPLSGGEGLEARADLDDVQVGSACAANVDLNRVRQRALGKGLDLGGHGGAEHERLPLALEEGHDVAHLLLKPTVNLRGGE